MVAGAQADRTPQRSRYSARAAGRRSARISSSTSGLRFWGMMLEPVVMSWRQLDVAQLVAGEPDQVRGQPGQIQGRREAARRAPDTRSCPGRSARPGCWPERRSKPSRIGHQLAVQRQRHAVARGAPQGGAVDVGEGRLQPGKIIEQRLGVGREEEAEGRGHRLTGVGVAGTATSRCRSASWHRRPRHLRQGLQQLEQRLPAEQAQGGDHLVVAAAAGVDPVGQRRPAAGSDGSRWRCGRPRPRGRS